jgi:uncharacterized RDD family membrane protein YckC
MDMPAMAPAAVGHSYAGDAPLAGRGARLAAALVDAVLFGVSMLPGFVLGGALAAAGASEEISLSALAGFFVGPILLALYTIHILVRDGQTLGKKAMKIRIVNYDDGGNPGFKGVILMRGFVNGLLSNIPFYALVDVLFIFGSEQRCLHDLIAKTKVVRANA